MSSRVLFVAFFAFVLFTSCMTSRYTTHWIVNNYSDKDVSLNVNVARPGSNGRTKTHTIKPGLQELGSETFSKGTYTLVAATSDVSKASRLHVESDTWVIISFTNEDSVNIQRRYGYVDTSVLKKINGKYTGVDIYNETRKPPILYTVAVQHK